MNADTLLLLIGATQTLCVGISFFCASFMVFFLIDAKILRTGKNYALTGIFVSFFLFFVSQFFTYGSRDRDIPLFLHLVFDSFTTAMVIIGASLRTSFVILDSKRNHKLFGAGWIVILVLTGLSTCFVSVIYYSYPGPGEMPSWPTGNVIIMMMFLATLVTIIITSLVCVLKRTQQVFFPFQYRYILERERLRSFGVLLLFISLGEMISVTAAGPIFLSIDEISSLFLVIIGSSVSIISLCLLFLIIYTGRERHKEIAWKLVAVQLEELKELDRLKDQFISMTSHELITPLTTISMNVDLVQRNDFDMEQLGKRCESIKRNLARIQRIVDDSYSLSEIKKDLFTYKFSEVMLVELIEHVVDDTRGIAEKRGLDLVFDKQELGDQNVIIDPDRIAQVVRNLIENAIKFTIKGIITVTLKEEENNLVIAVKDTGRGIKEDKIPLIFEAFNKTREKRLSKGLGLGLFISRNIVEKHGGSIWVESTVDKGSIFYFTIPRK